MTLPLTPEDCDLQDSKYMPMYVQQMLNSSFNAMADDTAWRAGVTLWMRSWHQVPAASLPDDDEELCQFAGLGRDVKTWKKIRAKALRGWIICSDGRIYHPILAEAALEAWIGALLARISSGEGNAKRWNTVFDRRPIEAQVRQSYALLKALNPRADAVQKLDRRNAKDKKPDSEPPPDVVPPGYQSDILPGSQPEPEPEPELVIDDDDDAGVAPARSDGVSSTDALGWPADKRDWAVAICEATNCADLSRNPKEGWPVNRLSIEEIRKWHDAGVHWQTVVEVIPDVLAKKRDGPPNSMTYFAKAVAQSHANRLQALSIPEAQPHERRNQPFRTTGERNQDSTVAAFARVFGGPADGETEPGDAA